MEILLGRHGQTDFNLELRIQGQIDAPLNDSGKSDAKKLRESVELFFPEMVFSSDLVRARETAEIAIANLDGKQVVTDKRLRERGMGDWEGTPISKYRAHIEELTATQSEKAGRELKFHELELGSGIEEIPVIIERLSEFFVWLLRDYEIDKVFIVAHKIVNLSIMHLLADIPHEELSQHSQSQTCLNLLEGNEIGKFNLIYSDDPNSEGYPATKEKFEKKDS